MLETALAIWTLICHQTGHVMCWVFRSYTLSQKQTLQMREIHPFRTRKANPPAFIDSRKWIPLVLGSVPGELGAETHVN